MSLDANLDGLKFEIQEDTLLGIHARGLGTGDAEEHGIEAGDVVEEPASTAITSVRRKLGPKPIVEVPARRFADQNIAPDKMGPQVGKRGCSGISATHAYYRDRFPG